MVGVPVPEIGFAHYAQLVVGLGSSYRCSGTGSHSAAQTADAAHDVAAVLVLYLWPCGVTVVVEEPPLDSLGTFLGVRTLGEVGCSADAVQHSVVPVVVPLHPTCIVGIGLIGTIGAANVGTAVVDTIGIAHIDGHLVFGQTVVGEGILEVSGHLVLQNRSVGEVECVPLIGEHVADA